MIYTGGNEKKGGQVAKCTHPGNQRLWIIRAILLPTFDKKSVSARLADCLTQQSY